MEKVRKTDEVATTSTGLATYNPNQASLMQMREDTERFPRLKAMPREQAVMGISKIVSQAFLYRGQAADPTNIQFISSALVQELLEDDKYGAAYITLGEIQVVVKRAVLGDSEMFGISVASLYKIIMEYVRGEGHMIQKQVEEARRAARKKALDSTGVNPMILASAGKFVKNQKNK